MKPVVFDLDDLCDYWDPYNLLVDWKTVNPNGKVTLFAIPGRCSTELIAKYRALPWVRLAAHGWWHQTGECLSWSAEETELRLRTVASWGFTKGFKAPGWLMTRSVVDGANAAGFWVAGHSSHREVWKKGDNTYVYNRKRRVDDWTAAHGHTHDTCDNGIDESFASFCFPPSTEFKFVSEVVTCES